MNGYGSNDKPMLCSEMSTSALDANRDVQEHAETIRARAESTLAAFNENGTEPVA